MDCKDRQRRNARPAKRIVHMPKIKVLETSQIRSALGQPDLDVMKITEDIQEKIVIEEKNESTFVMFCKQNENKNCAVQKSIQKAVYTCAVQTAIQTCDLKKTGHICGVPKNAQQDKKAENSTLR